MLLAPKTTHTSLLSTYYLLRNVRGLCDREEIHLRMIRHVLAVYLQLPGAFAPLRATPERDANKVLELAGDALADIVGETADDSRLLARARGQIATMLNDMPTVLFKDGAFVILPAGSQRGHAIDAR